MRAPSRWARFSGWRPSAAVQLGGGLLLGLALLLATLNNDPLYALFDSWWDWAGSALGRPSASAGKLLSASPVTLLLQRPHSLLAVGLYSVLYLGLCLGLLYLLVPARASRQLVLLFYGGAGLATGLLLLGSQVGGSPVLAGLASQLGHFIVSPLPVVGLVPLLRWAAPTTA